MNESVGILKIYVVDAEASATLTMLCGYRISIISTIYSDVYEKSTAQE